MDSQTLLQEALILPEKERLFLVERLLETLPPDMDELSPEEFQAELERRTSEIKERRGEVVSWEQLKNEEV